MSQLLTPQQLHEYQRKCVIHQLENDDSMLWLGMGLGKTPVTLTTIVDRMRAGQVKKTLIFGPLRVIQSVWAREARKWSHTKHLRFSVIHGVKEKRSRALFADADIYLINYEAMNWLAEQLDHYYISQGKSLPFQMVVYDEVSKLKNSTTLRMAGGNRDRKDGRGEHYKIKVTGWRKMINQFKYKTGLTGTPASNGYLDLHGQFLAVDGGERLGEYITHYKDSYFTSDYSGWNYTPTDLGKQWIEHKISDITVKMDSRDYLDLPDCQVTNIMVDLPAAARKAYKEMEKQMFTQLDSGSEVEVFSRSSVSNKTLQFCNGSPYLSSESPEFEVLHDAKLNALEDILEEAAGSPVLCSYSFTADAERIMKKFKKYHPVNLTKTPSKDTEHVINKWNNGQIKLLVGHPACLHPDTLVLTEWNGWVKLFDVNIDERVFDGVEFVSHRGCSYSGYEDVTDVFGVTMTHNHKLLISNEWMEAKNVRDCENIRKEASYKYEGDDQYLSEMFTLRGGVTDTSPECHEAQSSKKKTLQTLYSRNIPHDDRFSNLANMDGDKISSKRLNRQKLCRSRYYIVSRVARVYCILQRHARKLRRTFDHRKSKCKQTLLQRKLYMGDNTQTTIEQEEQSKSNLQRGRNPFSRTLSKEQMQQNDAINEAQSRNDRGRISEGCNEFTLRKEQQKDKQKEKGTQKAHVYDLVDCGPRHRFLIKNKHNDVFISHNSMGHGVDGLQDSGHIVVWFGINWSLELYDQMNGRIDRQGQSHPVSIIRILCSDTIDLAVADAIERKTDDQEGLKSALQRYRDGVTKNELVVNFF